MKMPPTNVGDTPCAQTAVDCGLLRGTDDRSHAGGDGRPALDGPVDYERRRFHPAGGAAAPTNICATMRILLQRPCWWLCCSGNPSDFRRVPAHSGRRDLPAGRTVPWDSSASRRRQPRRCPLQRPERRLPPGHRGPAPPRRRPRAASASPPMPARPAACASARWKSSSSTTSDEDLSLASLSAPCWTSAPTT